MRIVFIIPILLLILNAGIYLQTKNKIKLYADNPPFMATDLTGSYKLNHESKIANLLDHNQNTRWYKMRNSPTDDFILELRLTHLYRQGYKPVLYKTLHILSCDAKPQRIKLTLFLREAINVDKELRMPEDTIVKTFNVSLMQGQITEINIQKDFQVQETDQFPDHIFIIGVKGKLADEHGCINDIYLTE